MKADLILSPVDPIPFFFGIDKGKKREGWCFGGPQLLLQWLTDPKMTGDRRWAAVPAEYAERFRGCLPADQWQAYEAKRGVLLLESIQIGQENGGAR